MLWLLSLLTLLHSIVGLTESKILDMAVPLGDVIGSSADALVWSLVFFWFGLRMNQGRSIGAALAVVVVRGVILTIGTLILADFNASFKPGPITLILEMVFGVVWCVALVVIGRCWLRQMSHERPIGS